MMANRENRDFIKQYAPKEKQADMLAKNEARYEELKKEWNDTINRYNKEVSKEKDPKKRHAMYREYNKKLSEIEKEKRQLKN